jgi:ribosomal protein uL24
MNTKTIRPSKQRKRMATGVYHTKRRLLVAPLDKAMEKEVAKKKAVLRKGDTVKIMVGKNKGKTSTVSKVNYDKGMIYLKDIKVTNSRGQEKSTPINASNLLITNLVLTDKKRFPKKEVKKK